jgi:hypothetical protein
MSRSRAFVLVVCAATSTSSQASALLLDKAGDDPVPYTVFYPYPTSYTYVDEGYAFEDDPLQAFQHEPLIIPIKVKKHNARPALIAPRMEFVKEMFDSAEVL